MAIQFPKQQRNVADLGFAPTAKHDGRQIGAAKRITMASKVPGVAWAIGDLVYLGRKSAGHTLLSVKLCTDTSLATSTVSVGIGSDPKAGAAAPVSDATKYVNAATLTVTDRATEIGVKATTLDDDPPGEEHLWATIGGAAIAAGTNLTFILETVGID